MSQTTSQPWLLLRRNADGLPGAFLQEHIDAYGCFNRIAKCSDSRPRGLGVIGGWLKRHVMGRERYTRDAEHRSVALGSTGSTVVFDCELHLLQGMIPRVHAGPSKGNVVHHPTSPSLSTAHLAYLIYCDVLSQFCDSIVIFVPDFGGLQEVINMLCLWVSRLIAKDLSTSIPVLLIHTELPAEGEVPSRLAHATSAYMRTADPTRSYTSSTIANLVNNCVAIRDFPLRDDICRVVEIQTGLSFQGRVKRGLGFKAQHFKKFLQSSVSQFSKCPSQQFDFILASRTNYPLPDRIDSSVKAFLGDLGCKEIAIKLLASALVLDAYPAQMHC